MTVFRIEEWVVSMLALLSLMGMALRRRLYKMSKKDSNNG